MYCELKKGGARRRNTGGKSRQAFFWHFGAQTQERRELYEEQRVKENPLGHSQTALTMLWSAKDKQVD